MLLRAPLPIPLPLLLIAATSLATEPEVRTIARACAFAAIAGDQSHEAIIAMLLDPGTNHSRERSWPGRLDEASPRPQTKLLARVKQVRQMRHSAPSMPRRATMRRPVPGAGRGNREPANSRTRRGGRRSAGPRWRRHIAAPTDAVLDVRDPGWSRSTISLARVAWESGFPDLGPILIPASASLGVAGVNRLLPLLAVKPPAR